MSREPDAQVRTIVCGCTTWIEGGTVIFIPCGDPHRDLGEIVARARGLELEVAS